MSSSSSTASILTCAAVGATTLISTYMIYNNFFASSSSKRQEEVSEQTLLADSAKIKQIWIFPIAGCRGYCISKEGEGWNLVDGGLEFDREFCFYIPTTTGEDKEKKIVMKKLNTVPIQNEVFVKIEIVSANEVYLQAEYKNAPRPLKIRLPTAEETRAQESSFFDLERYGTFGKAVDMGDEAANWFKEFVFADMKKSSLTSDQESYKNNCLDSVRLARVAQMRRPVTKPSHRGSGAMENDSVRFQAFGGLHLMTEESLSWLQKQVSSSGIDEANVLPVSALVGNAENEGKSSPAAQKMIVGPERFRANLLISDVPNFHEDRWSKCQVVNQANNNNIIPLHFAKHTDRCEVPTMNPESGRRHPNMEPTSTIKKLRGARHPWQLANYAIAQAEYESKKKNTDNSDTDLVPPKQPAVKAMFGIEMFHDKNGRICVGDKIIPTEVSKKGLDFV